MRELTLLTCFLRGILLDFVKQNRIPKVTKQENCNNRRLIFHRWNGKNLNFLIQTLPFLWNSKCVRTKRSNFFRFEGLRKAQYCFRNTFTFRLLILHDLLESKFHTRVNFRKIRFCFWQILSHFWAYDFVGGRKIFRC